VGDFYAGRETSKASSGLALYHEGANEFVGIHITGQPSMTNSFMTEMVALALGARLAEAENVVVHSDCAAALASLRLRQSKRVKMSPYWQLGMLLDLESAVASAKVRAHPERHMVKIETLQDRGIMAADRFAGSPKGAALVVTAEEVLEALVSFSKVALVHLDTQTVAIENLNDLRVEFEFAEYLAKRDEVRVSAGRLPRWVGCNTRLGVYTVSAGKVGLAALSSATRIQYDWHYWGSNKIKAPGSLKEDGLCPLCGVAVEDQRHVLTECTHGGMSLARKRVWGDLCHFLDGVAKGDVLSALEEAQAAARADPRKERARLKRVEERESLQKLKDLDAYLRLSKHGLELRAAFAKTRAVARAAAVASKKGQAIRVVLAISNTMLSHPEGWTLMLGMPSKLILA